jgi:hypothetical protein
LRKFFAKDVDVFSSKLVINSYSERKMLKNLAHENIDRISQILVNQTIHLGGNYKNLQKYIPRRR